MKVKIIGMRTPTLNAADIETIEQQVNLWLADQNNYTRIEKVTPLIGCAHFLIIIFYE